jgi:hypothetical protein
MAGPKRCIALHCDLLLTFDMRIKNGEKEEDDLQLIDGVSQFEVMFIYAMGTKPQSIFLPHLLMMQSWLT